MYLGYLLNKNHSSKKLKRSVKVVGESIPLQQNTVLFIVLMFIQFLTAEMKIFLDIIERI